MAVPNIVYVTDAGVTAVNGTYTRGADSGGYPTWSNDGGYIIRIDNDGPGFKVWKLKNSSNQTLYSNTGVNFASATWPGEWPADPSANPAIIWVITAPFGQAPVPIFSLTAPALAEPTFGLSADVVALITSRFGTVANFLRLRNQGQV